MQTQKLCFLLVLLSLSGIANAQDSYVKDTLNAVVHIAIRFPAQRADHPPELLPLGTGFLIGNPPVVMTAAHVFWEGGLTLTKQRRGEFVMWKRGVNGKMFCLPIHASEYDNPHDVAIFKFDAELFRQHLRQNWSEYQIKPLMLADNAPEDGDEVIFAGYFGGDEMPVISRGIVAGRAKVPNTNVEDFLVDRPVNPGMSGGPLVLLKSGKAVGVLSSFVAGPVATPGAPQSHSGLSRIGSALGLRQSLGSDVVR